MAFGISQGQTKRNSQSRGQSRGRMDKGWAFGGKVATAYKFPHRNLGFSLERVLHK